MYSKLGRKMLYDPRKEIEFIKTPFCSILLNIKLFTKYLIIHIIQRHGGLDGTEECSAKIVTLIWQK